MARVTSSLARHIGITVISLHAILLPLLYYGVDYSVRASYEDSFINHVRAYSKTLADEVESGGALGDDASMSAFLDSLALGGEVTYAEIGDGDRVVRSTLLPVPQHGLVPTEDYAFGSGEGNTYFVSTLIVTNGRTLRLRLGFDELPTREAISHTRHGVLTALAAYTTAIVLAAWLFSLYLARPLRELRTVSRRIASGDFSQRLHASSRISEVSDLATDLESMRRELVGVNAQLARQMEEHSVLQARLHQKQRLETVGTLAGGVAHEFNNVLVPIMLYAQMALDTVEPEHPAHSDMQRVVSATRRASSVVAKVLTFSRHFDTQLSTAINIATAVDEGLRLFSALRPKDIEITADISQNCPPVVADHTLIVQIVMNLCTNASQAMHATGGALYVGLSDRMIAAGTVRDVPAGHYVELVVSDTGRGMDAATIERIFEPFFTNREVGSGTGLGLSVVHGIVTGMGASVLVESEPGKGAKFQILMPAASVSPSAAGSET